MPNAKQAAREVLDASPGMHQTKGARTGRFAAGHLQAPFAGDARCSAGEKTRTQ